MNMNISKTQPDVSKDTPENDGQRSRPVTLRENVVLTLKLLAGMGLLGAALWSVDVWMMAK
jgi:hypothetical protein